MHLAHVEVRNFRCRRELRVDLQQGLNVLVGRTNVGKTSLLAAIRHALWCRRRPRRGALVDGERLSSPRAWGLSVHVLFHQRDKCLRRQFR
ncbi:MAG: DUF2813 domain-containing protein [Alphaproteobacteria bacterium]|nr:MAG: DUF2813 domain-containing protein [Alphaproteobacteria bacterium]